MEGGVDLINAVFTGSHAELFTEGHPDGRSHLGDDPFGGIEQGVPDLSLGLLMVMAPVGQTAAHWPQLTHSVSASFRLKAGDTIILEPRLTKSMAPTCWISLHMRTQSPQKDALVHIPDNGGRGVVDLVIGPVVLKADIVKAEPAGQGLELAFLVLFTDGAVPAVGGQQKLQDHFSCGGAAWAYWCGSPFYPWAGWSREAMIFPLSSSTTHIRQAP